MDQRFLMRVAAIGLWVGMLLWPVTAQAEEVHIVQPGETLSQIAQQHSTSVEALRSLNALNNVNFVWAGQRLVLPEDAESTASPSESSVELLRTGIYEVKAGDTLFSIAARHRTSLAWLAEQNKLNVGQRLTPGRELVVPALTAEALVDGEMRVHIVQPGESIGSIANLYSTTSGALLQVNNLTNPNRITPGQRILLAPPQLFERMGMNSRVDENGFLVYDEYPTTTEKWIAVDLSEQRVTAYEGTTPVRAFVVSTGLSHTPTVTGSFRIWAKTPLQDMYGGNRAAGDYYYIANVPWVQYFYQDYAFHGVTWHANFGRPASRGCINMRTDEAKWLFEWASPTFNEQGWFISDEENPGTLVIVHQ
ncbi:LysM peptidoglycan-binding domain-containing protein [bacterium]|nr:LysM peptidoglycan-binding domain-containing protein [bacterium]